MIIRMYDSSSPTVGGVGYTCVITMGTNVHEQSLYNCDDIYINDLYDYSWQRTSTRR